MEIEPLGRLGYGSRGWDLGFEARGGYAEGEEGEISPCVKAKVIGPIFGATAQKGRKKKEKKKA